MEKESESLPESLMRSIINEASTQALKDFSESLLDDITEGVVQNDLLTKVPIVGIAVGLIKGGLAIRDRRYVSKLLSFLSEVSKASEEDKNKYRKKLDDNPAECRKAGIIILDVIEKIVSNEKAVMIGKLFRAFMHNEISADQLIGLCEMIEKAYLSDLMALSAKDGDQVDTWNDANLESVGIKKPMRVEDVNNAIDAAMSRMLAQMPIIQDAPIKTEETPKVVQSGFTEAGFALRKILRDY